MTVAETPLFVRKAEKLLDEEERAALIATIAQDPEAGEIMPGTGGVRKLRWSLDGRGKSGGARVIYYFHSDRMPVVLQAGRNELKTLVPELVREFMKKGRRL